ncbi:MAG: hypothetical protein JXB13_20385 [Phycisphaerae bacterium]|nr:hypothetical protein [Phycisphaerae bacterium]
MWFAAFAFAWLGCAAGGVADSSAARTSQPAADRPAWVIRESAPTRTEPVGPTTRSTGPADSLARANDLLARQIEPAVSRWFLGLALPGDGERVLNGVRQARMLLAEVQADAGEPAPSANRWQDDIDALNAFARAVEDVFAAGEDQADAAERDAAAIQLAVLLEDDRAEVASAARLWRAALFRRLERHDRVLALLPEPLAGLSAEGQRFDFYGRLLRVRSIADQGGYATACTLLLQIEDECDEWFPAAENAVDARRAAVAVRTGILRQWADALDPATHREEREWCLRAIERVRTAACSEPEPCPVLPLEMAVPVLARPPARLTTTRAADEP